MTKRTEAELIFQFIDLNEKFDALGFYLSVANEFTITAKDRSEFAPICANTLDELEAFLIGFNAHENLQNEHE